MVPRRRVLMMPYFFLFPAISLEYIRIKCISLDVKSRNVYETHVCFMSL